MNKKLIIAILTAVLLVSAVTVLIVVLASRIPDPSQYEHVITKIQLSSPMNAKGMEYSGLDWYEDYLIFLPQNPEDVIYKISKDDIVAYLLSDNPEDLVGETVDFEISGNLDIDDFQGYEAIAFDGDKAYLTIEAGGILGEMRSYFIVGDMSLDKLILDASSLTQIPQPNDRANMAHEALLMVDSGVPMMIYEWNNFDPDSSTTSTAIRYEGGVIDVDFPKIPYRVTDSTNLDTNDRFWMINYLFPGDASRSDIGYPYSQYLIGTHAARNQIESIIELQYNRTTNSVIWIDQVPLFLALENQGRNWEGLVRLSSTEKNGFLLVTDRYPRTYFAFVENEQ